MKMLACMSLTILCLRPLVSAESPANGPQTHVRVCRSHADKVYDAKGAGTTEVLDFGRGQTIVVEPSVPVADLSETFDARFDYRIIFKPSGRQFQISALGKSPDERDEIAYRLLDSVGVFCVSADNALIYLSFSVNGSMRDFLYLGIHVRRETSQPIVLGSSSYGVLSVESADPFHFSIWDSTEVTRVNSMGMHTYHVLSYRWAVDDQSIELIDQHDSKPVYPGQVMGKGEESIRVGNPRVP
jgi:hypothetical protein